MKYALILWWTYSHAQTAVSIGPYDTLADCMTAARIAQERHYSADCLPIGDLSGLRK